MNPRSLPADTHAGWHRLNELLKNSVLTRRRFLPGAAAAALLPTLSRMTAVQAAGLPDQANWHSNNKIKHVVILCQENRSFDHYFGAFAWMFGTGKRTAVGFNPQTLTYYDKFGQPFHTYQLMEACNLDPDHSWEGSHAKWNNGKMNGWVTAEGGATTALGYYLAADHLYHVQLAQAFTLSDHNFCSQIGPTLPNRLYLWTGTSGWNYLTPTTTANHLPFNNPSLTAPPPLLTWPTMADVLDSVGLPWKCYSVADGSVPSAIGAFNPLIFFSQMQTNPAKLARATADFSEFLSDLAAGTLPAVSWIVTEAVVSEHPPAAPDMGQLLAARVVDALMQSSAWQSSVLFLTYDEGGGFFETIPPQILEKVPAPLPQAGVAVGPAFRVPLFVVSPFARRNYVFESTTDHTSILQFVESTFSSSAKPVHLPTISAGRRTLNNLAGAFDFAQLPNSPALPTAAQLYAQASQTVLALNGTVASCAVGAPNWLPPLLGVS
jgi:phospholipase C